jgi:hypothetical protein
MVRLRLSVDAAAKRTNVKAGQRDPSSTDRQD